MITRTLVLLALLTVFGPAVGDERFPAPASLSPEAQAYLNKAKTGAMLQSVDVTDPKMMATMRRALGGMFLRMAKKIDPDVYTTEQDLGGIKGYWINNPMPEVPGKVIMYFHGGGYILGSAQENLGSGIRISRASNIPVLSVEFRLAPEHPFPAGLEDSLKAYRWMLDNGYEGKDIAIYGDSSGGGQVLAIALAARDRGWDLPAAVVAISPLTDMTEQGDTRIILKDVDPIIRTVSTGRYEHFTDGESKTHPLISPLYADYKDFPPLLIQVGTREILLSDATRLAQVARAAGVEVVLDVWDGMWHGWHDSPDVPEAEQACEAVADFVVAHFDGAM
ncbi:MAG: alpha/beta hydrolase [Gammaproteobacteria bacterium]|jgi:acetyl esterase/lipase|nr:alpha/beta hydrolase [Gammaproteobacteria bacterium]MDP6616514.1 alpha/beta hydrolase [Gammaproteobacteria bacterium]MDP6694237.1 alpha/beta hydrolase [Gammaproteobacteria bacterium]